MPSLLSRILGRKKNVEQSSLLDGEKYEAVQKTTSPSEPSFDQVARGIMSKAKGSDKTQGRRSKRPSAALYDSHLAESAPILSLSLPEVKNSEKKSAGLGVVFESIAEGPQTMDDQTLGEKRLSPSETLGLVQKTSEVLVERGLETLGVMRPHWFASPRQQEIQLKLIQRFLETLGTAQKSSTIGAPPSPRSAFDSELRYSRDPHDVAAVFRWGLRHFKQEGRSFGKSASGDWYRTFAEAERSGSYPVKAFDDILVPLLPDSHTNLLRAVLDMVSSLAAHSEENGISGNKLSKVLGWWVVSSRNIQGARWPEFYAHWEDAARQFEHLFLAYIRAQDAQSRMPKRLTELIKNYPFVNNRREEDGLYLPRSRFSTRSADALFVQVRVNSSNGASRPHPLLIIEDALRAVAEDHGTDQYSTLWEELRNLVSQSAPPSDDSKEGGTKDSNPPLDISSILSDESIRLFSLVPTPDDASAPTLSLFTPIPPGRGRRSLSVGERPPTSPTTNGRPQSSASAQTPATSTSPSSRGQDVTPDWQTFSSAGFETPTGLSLAASLWDNDTEISQPVSKKSGGISKRNGFVRPRSADPPPSSKPAVGNTPKPIRRTYSVPRLVKLDEAFIDFWADSLLDSIARTWPTFVVCQLKPLAALKKMGDDKPVEWLIIERVTEEAARPVPAPIKTSSSARPASPLPSPTRSDDSKRARWASATFSAARKRLSALSLSKSDSVPAMQLGRDRGSKKVAKGTKVGEMGEILKEVDERAGNGVKVNGAEKNETPKEPVEKVPEFAAVKSETATDSIPNGGAEASSSPVKQVTTAEGSSHVSRVVAKATSPAEVTALVTEDKEPPASDAPAEQISAVVEDLGILNSVSLTNDGKPTIGTLEAMPNHEGNGVEGDVEVPGNDTAETVTAQEIAASEETRTDKQSDEVSS